MSAPTVGADPASYLALQRSLDEPTTDVALTPRESELRDLARTVVASEIAPRAAHLDATHTFAHEGVQALARAGLCGLLFPEELGGTGDTHVAYAVVMEEIAAACAATSLVFMTQTHAAYPILHAGGEELRRRYIPGLLDGSRYGALAITEPDAGSDVAGLTTSATPTATGWSLTGQKTFITTGDRADTIVCFATVNRRLARDGVTAFVVDGGWQGVGHGRPFHKMGMHGSSTAELFFDGVAIPPENLLGQEGGGWSALMGSVAKSRISAAAQGVGLARSAYAQALVQLGKLHGSRIPDDQSFVLAELRGSILQGRLLLHAVARQADTDPGLSTAQIGMMKQVCTDLGFRTAVRSAQLLGPYGDLADVGVERCLRDAKVTQIYDGTNEIQRLLISRETTRRMEDWT